MPLTAEQTDAYTKFFKAADKDGSGRLSVQELKAILTCDLKLKLTDAQVIEMFQGVDQNNDGEVTLQEFMNEMSKVNPKDLQKADFERVFAQIDTNNDRKLDAKEIKRLFEGCGHKVNDDQVAAIIKKIDKDGDGQIDIDEFLRLF